MTKTSMAQTLSYAPLNLGRWLLWSAYALVLPLFLFTLLTFLVPIALMLVNSVHDPLVADSLPRTALGKVRKAALRSVLAAPAA